MTKPPKPSKPAKPPKPSKPQKSTQQDPELFASELDLLLDWAMIRQASLTPATGRRLLQALRDMRHHLTEEDALAAQVFAALTAPTPASTALLLSDVDGHRGTLVLNQGRVRWLHGNHHMTDYSGGPAGLRAIQSDGAYSVQTP